MKGDGHLFGMDLQTTFIDSGVICNLGINILNKEQKYIYKKTSKTSFLKRTVERGRTEELKTQSLRRVIQLSNLKPLFLFKDQF